MLKGKAKITYMREYMRRRRAGQPAKPKRVNKRRAEQERAAQQQAELEARPKVCTFCFQPASLTVGNGGYFICEKCVAEAVEIIATQRQQ